MKTETSILSAIIIIVIVISFYIRKPDLGSLVQILFFGDFKSKYCRLRQIKCRFFYVYFFKNQSDERVLRWPLLWLFVNNTGKLSQIPANCSVRVGQKNDNPNFSRSLRWPLTSIEQTFSTDIWKYDTSLYSLTEAIEPEQLDNRSRERKLFRSESRFSNYIIAIPALHYHFNCLSLYLLLDRSVPLCGPMDTILCLFPKYSESKNLIIHYFTIIKAQK